MGSDLCRRACTYNNSVRWSPHLTDLTDLFVCVPLFGRRVLYEVTPRHTKGLNCSWTICVYNLVAKWNNYRLSHLHEEWNKNYKNYSLESVQISNNGMMFWADNLKRMSPSRLSVLSAITSVQQRLKLYSKGMCPCHDVELKPRLAACFTFSKQLT